MKLTSHQLAAMLLAGPDLPMAIQYDGEYLAYSSDPATVQNTTGEELVIVGLEEPAGQLSVN